METIFFQGKEIIISVHAIKRARQRNIAYPDQIYETIKSGKIKRFGKHYIRFSKKTKNHSIICIAEDLGEHIIIKTVERGN